MICREMRNIYLNCLNSCDFSRLNEAYNFDLKTYIFAIFSNRQRRNVWVRDHPQMNIGAFLFRDPAFLTKKYPADRNLRGIII